MENILLHFRIWRNRRGQDLIEYALMAGFVAVATGATFPPAANAISQIFSKVQSVMTAANKT
jgi:pilus assembly protein Flp/PilA